ncbi:uncharacterized protein LOC113515148 [Galleria mellonella]|uniref:Uncharacterized protein LOC113515148 n=1 Tax=Galleria mellonella TaxID=7137 RepID=A0A6J1WKX3_GALME|nr:uncharacterized protein LOC113515148 [Galleria mellonella]XP_052751784.1 uncharacterized protein LOC113515148 [Galleria mellonella]XP_052751785.1 uncharacterized protein LOC113515148 [Galleria mellonella]
MDVYGYPPYQYSQSEELTKQMFAQQAMGTSLPYSRDISGPHVMPVPSGIPWNMQGLPWGMQSPPHLVQFTAQTPNVETKITSVIHCKRKNLDVEPTIPAKQLITEEKMAAHLNSLHISSEYTSHSLAYEDFMDVNMEMPSTSTSTSISDKLKDKFTIVLSEEVKKIKDQPLLPPALIERLEKPQMSLVVWKPRENILEKLKDVTEQKTDSEEEQPKKRNGLLVAEHSGMDIEM